MPYGVEYPVAFVAGGDTTRDAFGKHIQEIERIYGILNSLDSNKLDSTTFNTTLGGKLKEHIDDSNPHPNYKPAFGNITGTLDGSKVSGNLSNATIAVGRVTGLESYVKGLIPDDKGDGITDAKLSEVGSVTFKNGLIVKWGNSGTLFAEKRFNWYEYPTAFPKACYTVLLSYTTPSPWQNVSGGGCDDCWVQLVSYNKEGFYCARQADNGETGTSSVASVNYLAIGK